MAARTSGQGSFRETKQILGQEEVVAHKLGLVKRKRASLTNAFLSMI